MRSITCVSTMGECAGGWGRQEHREVLETRAKQVREKLTLNIYVVRAIKVQCEWGGIE
jgi:hypothetical protein